MRLTVVRVLLAIVLMFALWRGRLALARVTLWSATLRATALMRRRADLARWLPALRRSRTGAAALGMLGRALRIRRRCHMLIRAALRLRAGLA